MESSLSRLLKTASPASGVGLNNVAMLARASPVKPPAPALPPSRGIDLGKSYVAPDGNNSGKVCILDLKDLPDEAVQTTTVAMYNSQPAYTNGGALVASGTTFNYYVVASSKVRVIAQDDSTVRALLPGHGTAAVTDIQLRHMPDPARGRDIEVVATADESGVVQVWALMLDTDVPSGVTVTLLATLIAQAAPASVGGGHTAHITSIIPTLLRWHPTLPAALFVARGSRLSCVDLNALGVPAVILGANAGDAASGDGDATAAAFARGGIGSNDVNSLGDGVVGGTAAEALTALRSLQPVQRTLTDADHAVSVGGTLVDFDVVSTEVTSGEVDGWDVGDILVATVAAELPSRGAAGGGGGGGSGGEALTSALRDGVRVVHLWRGSGPRTPFRYYSTLDVGCDDAAVHQARLLRADLQGGDVPSGPSFAVLTVARHTPVIRLTTLPRDSATGGLADIDADADVVTPLSASAFASKSRSELHGHEAMTHSLELLNSGTGSSWLPRLHVTHGLPLGGLEATGNVALRSNGDMVRGSLLCVADASAPTVIALQLAPPAAAAVSSDRSRRPCWRFSHAISFQSPLPIWSLTLSRHSVGDGEGEGTAVGGTAHATSTAISVVGFMLSTTGVHAATLAIADAAPLLSTLTPPPSLPPTTILACHAADTTARSHGALLQQGTPSRQVPGVAASDARSATSSVSALLSPNALAAAAAVVEPLSGAVALSPDMDVQQVEGGAGSVEDEDAPPPASALPSAMDAFGDAAVHRTVSAVAATGLGDGFASVSEGEGDDGGFNDKDGGGAQATDGEMDTDATGGGDGDEDFNLGALQVHAHLRPPSVSDLPLAPFGSGRGGGGGGGGGGSDSDMSPMVSHSSPAAASAVSSLARAGAAAVSSLPPSAGGASNDASSLHSIVRDALAAALHATLPAAFTAFREALATDAASRDAASRGEMVAALNAIGDSLSDLADGRGAARESPAGTAAAAAAVAVAPAAISTAVSAALSDGLAPLATTVNAAVASGLVGVTESAAAAVSAAVSAAVAREVPKVVEASLGPSLERNIASVLQRGGISKLPAEVAVALKSAATDAFRAQFVGMLVPAFERGADAIIAQVGGAARDAALKATAQVEAVRESAESAATAAESAATAVSAALPQLADAVALLRDSNAAATSSAAAHESAAARFNSEAAAWNPILHELRTTLRELKDAASDARAAATAAAAATADARAAAAAAAAAVTYAPPPPPQHQQQQQQHMMHMQQHAAMEQQQLQLHYQQQRQYQMQLQQQHTPPQAQLLTQPSVATAPLPVMTPAPQPLTQPTLAVVQPHAQHYNALPPFQQQPIGYGQNALSAAPTAQAVPAVPPVAAAETAAAAAVAVATPSAPAIAAAPSGGTGGSGSGTSGSAIAALLAAAAARTTSAGGAGGGSSSTTNAGLPSAQSSSQGLNVNTYPSSSSAPRTSAPAASTPAAASQAAAVGTTPAAAAPPVGSSLAALFASAAAAKVKPAAATVSPSVSAAANTRGSVMESVPSSAPSARGNVSSSELQARFDAALNAQDIDGIVAVCASVSSTMRPTAAVGSLSPITRLCLLQQLGHALTRTTATSSNAAGATAPSEGDSRDALLEWLEAVSTALYGDRSPATDDAIGKLVPGVVTGTMAALADFAQNGNSAAARGESTEDAAARTTRALRLRSFMQNIVTARS